MRYIIAVLLLILTSPTYAKTYQCHASLSAVTLRSDNTAATGIISYKLYGGDIGGPFVEIASTELLDFDCEVELSGLAGEFYAIACEDGQCGKQSPHVVAQCGRAIIGITSLTINLECN